MEGGVSSACTRGGDRMLQLVNVLQVGVAGEMFAAGGRGSVSKATQG